MSSPPKFVPLAKEDFAEQAAWIERLLRPINSFATATVAALSKGLTLDDNVQAQIQELAFTTADPIEETFPKFFSVKTAQRPRTVTIGSVENLDDPKAVFSSAVFATWTFASDGQVRIGHVTGLATNTKYRLRFVCFA